MKSKLLLLLLLLGSSLSSRLIYAQNAQPVYLLVEYMKVKPGQGTRYLETEKAWKQLHQERVEAGKILGWNLYEVVFPEGTERDYDYVTTAAFRSLADLEAPYPEEIVQPFLSRNSSLMPIFEKTGETRDLVYGELWQQVSATQTASGSAGPSKYVLVDYQRVLPGKEGAYLDLEQNTARPFHEERVKADKINGWGLYRLVLPGGTDVGYNFATGNFFDSLNQMENFYPEALVRRALPGREMNELIQEIVSKRETVNTTLWQLVDHTE